MLQTTIDRLKSHITELKFETEQSCEKIEILHTSIEELKSQITKNKDDNKELKLEVATNNRKIQELQEENTQLKHDSKSKEEHIEKIDDVRNRTESILTREFA